MYSSNIIRAKSGVRWLCWSTTCSTTWLTLIHLSMANGVPPTHLGENVGPNRILIRGQRLNRLHFKPQVEWWGNGQMSGVL